MCFFRHEWHDLEGGCPHEPPSTVRKDRFYWVGVTCDTHLSPITYYLLPITYYLLLITYYFLLGFMAAA
jgi:hypothetical protein